MEEKKSKAPRYGEQQQKLTYEQLNNICSELYQQNQNLVKQLQQNNLANMFKRLDYLFLVLQNSQMIEDKEFVNACVEEIKDALTLKKEEEREEG